MPWNEKKRTTQLAAALLALGFAAGVALGLVLAPQAGRKTRSRLRILARRGIQEAERVKDTAAKTIARMPFVAAG
jgi:gas vesicle protein